MVELDLVSGMLLTNRIQQKWQNDYLWLGFQRQWFHLSGILYWLFSHNGSDGEGNWGQGTEGRFWPMASGNGGPQAHSPKGIESWPPPLREPGRRFCVSWSCTPGTWHCPQSASWLKPCEWGDHPSWFAWEQETSWDAELSVLRPGRSWANWDELLTLPVRASEPEDPQKLR